MIWLPCLLVGFYFGILFGSSLTKKLYKDLIEDYKNSVNYWYDEWKECNKQRHEWYLK